MGAPTNGGEVPGGALRDNVELHTRPIRDTRISHTRQIAIFHSVSEFLFRGMRFRGIPAETSRVFPKRSGFSDSVKLCAICAKRRRRLCCRLCLSSDILVIKPDTCSRLGDEGWGIDGGSRGWKPLFSEAGKGDFSKWHSAAVEALYVYERFDVEIEFCCLNYVFQCWSNEFNLLYDVRSLAVNSA